MASITSYMTSTSSTSSIYGTRNVLSGLASGMDTESMIENAVSGIKSKITSLLQKRTRLEWQQEAFRSIIDKAVNLNNKYTSYTSTTNLLSSSFFSNAVINTVNGTYADKVTASGKSSSDIQINAVKQLATAATYTSASIAGITSADLGVINGGDFDVGGTIPVSTVSGTLTFQYGGTNGTTFDIKFDELENLNEVEVYNSDGSVKTNATNAEKLAQAIQNKLSEVTYNYTKNGYSESTTADKAVKVSVDAGGRITFSDGLGNGNEVKISSSTGNIKSIANEYVVVGGKDLTQDVSLKEYLSDKTLGFTFNGSTKTINLSDVLDKVDFSYDSEKDNNTQFAEALQAEIDKAYGSGKIEVSYGDGGLSFKTLKQGDVLALGGSGLEALGFESGDANYINAGKKLTDILGDKADSIFCEANRLKGSSAAIQKTTPNGTVYYVDSEGNSVDKDGYRIDSDGKALYDFEINGAHIGVTEDITLESLINNVNANPDAGVKITYSKLTNEFKFTATETGANSKVQLGSGMAQDLFGPSGGNIYENFSEGYDLRLSEGESARIKFDFGDGIGIYTINVLSSDSVQDVADKLNQVIFNNGLTASYDDLTGELKINTKSGKPADFSVIDQYGYEVSCQSTSYASYTPGQDAVMDVEINGVRFENLTRSTNSFDLDGLTVTVKGEFEAKGKDGEDYEPVTFTTTTDSDKIIDAIRQFVEDYNEMVTELKAAYSTLPGQQTDGSKYEPLTADQESGMTESEIAAYNEKAKQGLLFGDTTLSSFYSKLLNAIAPGGADGQTLREIGIGTTYSDGLTTLSLDEDKLRTALDTNPDKVKDAFTKTVEGGASSNGLMQTLQNTLNTYVKTTGEPKGALIVKAGSTKAPTSLNSNSLLSQMNSIDTQIERWETKMSNQIDRYTSQFTRLETLIAEMNSQYSALSGLMGGYSEY